MNDEIKEILDRLERIDHKEYSCDFEFADSATFDEMARCFEERKKMANYITILQQDTEMYAQLKDEYEEEIKDLQQENERLQENNSNMQEEMARVWQENEELRKNQRFHKKFGDDYIFCVEGDKETYKDMIFMYQEIIDKAIENLQLGINSYNNGGSRTALFECICDSKNILQNGSDENVSDRD